MLKMTISTWCIAEAHRRSPQTPQPPVRLPPVRLPMTPLLPLLRSVSSMVPPMAPACEPTGAHDGPRHPPHPSEDELVAEVAPRLPVSPPPRAPKPLGADHVSLTTPNGWGNPPVWRDPPSDHDPSWLPEPHQSDAPPREEDPPSEDPPIEPPPIEPPPIDPPLAEFAPLLSPQPPP